MTPTGEPHREPSFTVVMPVFNARRYLPLTIPPLLEAIRGAEAHLVVMDNGSTDGSLEWLRENAGEAQVHDAPDLTIGALRNRGAEQGTNAVLSFIDADCVVPPDYFDRIRDVLHSSGAESVGCTYALPDDPLWIEEDWQALNEVGGGRENGPVEWVPAGNFACMRSAFEAVGGFDEALVTGEDAELCLRLRQAGFTVWQSWRIEAKHLGNPKTLTGFFRKQRWHALGMFGTARRQLLDKPTILMFVHLFATMAGIVAMIVFGGWAGLGLLITLTLLAPAIAVLFRRIHSFRPRSVPRALLLFHLYLDARIAALWRILTGRARLRS